MNDHAIGVLEFELVRSRVIDHALTSEGEQVVSREGFLHTPGEISRYHRISHLIRRCRRLTIPEPAFSFPPVSDTLGRVATEGVVLEPEELASLRTYLRSAMLAKRYFTGCLTEIEEPGDELQRLIEPIVELPKLIAAISRVIDDDGAIKEREIPELREIRSQITRAEQDLARTAKQILNRDDTRRYWNSTVPTQREGRLVLALKSEHKGKVRGIVHEVSATGATVFLEPDSVVELNNRIAEAHNRYHAQLLKLLRELSAQCRAGLPDARATLTAVTELDRFVMRARYADRIEAETPSVGGKRFSLHQARHPLLDTPVPIELVFPPGTRLLIITGPNTGGKTVSLKTAGLLALMNQFGLELPASPETQMPVFDDVFADIGDEQSIQQNLSTFSGHMRNIAAIVRGAGKRSLVLLDELGSGTDPQEGGALARAILDELVDRRPFTVVTTHHGVLKHYGYTRQTAGNASVEFDPQSLRPTYRILPGVPGASHAIEIAGGQGLPEPIITAAGDYLDGEEQDVAAIIRRLTAGEQELRERSAVVEQSAAKIEAQEQELSRTRERLAQQEQALREGKLRDLDTFAAEARRQLENLVRKLREGEVTRVETQEVKRFIAEMDHFVEEGRSQTAQARRPPPTEPGSTEAQPLSVGCRVEIRSSGKTGTIARAGKPGTWFVQVGALRLPVDSTDLRRLPETDEPPTPRVEYAAGGGAPAGLEIDVRGRRLQEAIDEVERQIDAALLTGIARFGVIHGTGEGVLQRGIRELLASNPHVSDFSYALPEQGGFGKTIVVLG